MATGQAGQTRTESGRWSRLDPNAAGVPPSILDVISRLKEQILEKDRIISAKTGELVAARDYLRGVFAALADPVLVIDARGAVEFANVAAQELLGYREEELLGRAASALCADAEQASRFGPERLGEVMRAGAFERTDMLLRARDGSEVPVSWSSSPLDAAGPGGPRRLVGIARDVRVERRLEQEKLRAVQALAASVAHEIRNPLGAIQSSVGLLRRDLPVQGEDKTLLDIVFDETHRIGRIVTQFIDFARPVQPSPEAVDLATLVREVVTLAERDERARTRHMVLHVDDALAPVWADPGQVKQVVWNVVANALDAARGCIALRVRATAAGAGGAEVRVADDGPGMTPEVLARCFEPFRTTKAQGTGLGLAICKRIVEAHGGSIRVESAPGDGAAVTVTLPAAADPAAGAADPGEER